MITRLLNKYILLILLCFGLFAEPSFVFGGGLKYSKFHKESMPMLGAHAGVYTASLFMGASGFTSLNTLELEDDFGVHKLDNMSYGGFNIRYIPQSSALLRFSAGCLLGGGVFSFTNNHFYPSKIDDDIFLAIEPDIDIMLNFSQYLRLGYGISYRSLISPEIRMYDAPEISGFTTSIYAQFGLL